MERARGVWDQGFLVGHEHGFQAMATPLVSLHVGVG